MLVQPAVVRVTAFLALADVHHGPPPGSSKPIILVVTTIVKRCICDPLSCPRLTAALPSTRELLHFCTACLAGFGAASFRRHPLWCTVIAQARQALRGLRGFFNGFPIVHNHDENARALHRA